MVYLKPKIKPLGGFYMDWCYFGQGQKREGVAKSIPGVGGCNFSWEAGADFGQEGGQAPVVQNLAMWVSIL